MCAVQVAQKEVREEEESDDGGEEEESDEEVAAAPPLLVPAAGASAAQPGRAAAGPALAVREHSLEDEEAAADDGKDTVSANVYAQPPHAPAGSASPGYAPVAQLKDEPQAGMPMEASHNLEVTDVRPSALAQPRSDKWDEVMAAWENEDGPSASSAPVPAQGDILLAAPAYAAQPWAPEAALPAQQAAGLLTAHPLASSLNTDPSYGWLNNAAPLSLHEAAGDARPPSASSHASHAENQPPPYAATADSPERPLLQGVLAGGPPRSTAAPAAMLSAGDEGALGTAAEQRRAAEMRAELEARARLEMEGTLARIEKHFKASQPRANTAGVMSFTETRLVLLA